MGVVEFDNADDMKLAIRKLDDTEFKNPFDKGTFVRVVRGSRGGRFLGFLGEVYGFWV